MRGSHRGAADNSVLVLLAVAAAVIGLALYVIFDATSLDFWALSWLPARGPRQRRAYGPAG